MHTHREGELDLLLSTVEHLDAPALDRLQAAVVQRRAALGRESAVLERRDHRNGVLQLETRAYRRKGGALKERGPYWYFHYREGSKQKTLYVGKTDAPEVILDAKLKGKEE